MGLEPQRSRQPTRPAEHRWRHVPGSSQGNSIPVLPSLPILPFNAGCWKSWAVKILEI